MSILHATVCCHYIFLKQVIESWLDCFHSETFAIRLSAYWHNTHTVQLQPVAVRKLQICWLPTVNIHDFRTAKTTYKNPLHLAPPCSSRLLSAGSPHSTRDVLASIILIYADCQWQDVKQYPDCHIFQIIKNAFIYHVKRWSKTVRKPSLLREKIEWDVWAGKNLKNCLLDAR